VANLKRKVNPYERNMPQVSWDLSDSFHLRLLIHYIGDIHQPLHASSRYTYAFPKGDEGGNGLRINVTNAGKGETPQNLHSLWDSIIMSQASDMNLPLSTDNWSYLGNESLRLRTEYLANITTVFGSGASHSL
jgi:hypothetical protein